MNKYLSIAFIMVIITFSVTAEDDKKSFIGLDLFAGATYEFGDNTSSGDSFEDSLNFMVQVLTALRVGGGADLHFRIADPLSVGIEAGFFIFATQDDNGNTSYTPLIDIPVRAVVRLDFGKIAIQAHGGYNYSTTFNSLAAASDYMDINHKLDVGGRVFLGPFYVEYSRLFWSPDAGSLSAGSDRIGLGLNFNLF